MSHYQEYLPLRNDDAGPRGLEVIIGLAVLTVVLGILNNNDIIVVTFIYILVIVEVILVSVYLFGKERIFGLDPVHRRNSAGNVDTRKNVEMISPLAIFLKSAVRGSEFSRKEIARVIANIIATRYGLGFLDEVILSKSQIIELLGRGDQFGEDLQRVVGDYLYGKASEIQDVDPTLYFQSLRRLIVKLSENDSKTIASLQEII